MHYLKLFLRKGLIPLITMFGMERLLNLFQKPRYLILNYHGVVKTYHAEISRNHMSVEQFEEHLAYFKKHFNVISLETMLNKYREGKRPERNTLAITFDDGYENNYLNAFPLLRSFQFPASIFVSAQAISKPDEPLWYDLIDICRKDIDWEYANEVMSTKGTPGTSHVSTAKDTDALKRFIKGLNDEKKQAVLHSLIPESARHARIKSTDSEYWKLLSEGQMTELSASGLIEIGSHGLTHTNLDVLDQNELNRELRDSKLMLEKVTGKNINSIAYPDGAYSSLVKSECRSLSYKNLLAVDYHLPEDKNDDDIFCRHSISNTTSTGSVMISIRRAYRTKGF